MAARCYDSLALLLLMQQLLHLLSVIYTKSLMPLESISQRDIAGYSAIRTTADP